MGRMKTFYYDCMAELDGIPESVTVKQFATAMLDTLLGCGHFDNPTDLFDVFADTCVTAMKGELPE